MYSAFYRYINMYPLVHEDTLPSENIESVISAYSIFEEREKGTFYNNSNTSAHISMQLMKVADHNNWSNNDFDSKETNYIAIVISRNSIDEDLVVNILIDIAEKLQWILFEEDDGEGYVLFSPNK